MKLDIQGGELDALLGMEKTLLKCIGLEIEVEFAVVYKVNSIWRFKKYLQNIGFELLTLKYS